MLFFFKCCHGLSRNRLESQRAGIASPSDTRSCARKAISPINIDDELRTGLNEAQAFPSIRPQHENTSDNNFYEGNKLEVAEYSVILCSDVCEKDWPRNIFPLFKSYSHIYKFELAVFRPSTGRRERASAHWIRPSFRFAPSAQAASVDTYLQSKNLLPSDSSVSNCSPKFNAASIWDRVLYCCCFLLAFSGQTVVLLFLISALRACIC